jgi:hypothetical protein
LRRVQRGPGLWTYNRVITEPFRALERDDRGHGGWAVVAVSGSGAVTENDQSLLQRGDITALRSWPQLST